MTNRNVHTSKKLLTRREFLVGGGAVIAVAAFAACTNKVATTTSGTPSSTTTPATASGSSSTPKYGGTLRIIAGTSPQPTIGWPPEMAKSDASAVNQDTCESLLRGDGKGNIVPWLAESYKVADDHEIDYLQSKKGSQIP